MAFGSEWDNERKLAFKNKGNAEKMLELFIYDHMKKKDLHDVAQIFAKEANIETPQLMEIKENLLTEWWEVFWPILCSSLSNKVEVKIVNEEKYMFHGKEKDAEEMLHLYIYHYVKKRDLHEAAKIFAEEANIEMSELDYDECLLKDWWDVFWPRFFSRMTKQPGGNPQASAQPSMEKGLVMLASVKTPKVGISQQPPTENPPQHVSKPPEGMSQRPQGISQRRAGKRPMNTDTASILGQMAARKKGKGPLGFPPVKLLPTEITLVPHSGNLSHLQIPGTIQPPPQVAGAYRSVQLEPTYPAEQDSAYPPAAPIAGENYRKNQGLLSGVRVNEPDRPAPDSFMSHVPAAFFEFMQQEAKERRRRSNSSFDKS